MKTRALRYFGKKQDSAGMPVPFNSYYVMASRGPAGSMVADVVTIAGKAPPLEDQPLVERGGEDAALDAAETYLDKMNKGLEKQRG